jgi:hypothetical protein
LRDVRRGQDRIIDALVDFYFVRLLKYHKHEFRPVDRNNPHAGRYCSCGLTRVGRAPQHERLRDMYRRQRTHAYELTEQSPIEQTAD